MGLASLPPVAGLKYNRSVYLASGSLTLPTTGQGKFDALLVSGGGGGGRAGTTVSHYQSGGGGCFAYYADVTCTAGTTLTITVGAGGAGGTTNNSDGAAGTASTISGIVGNGNTTSLSSGSGPTGIYNVQGRGSGRFNSPSLFGFQWDSNLTSSTNQNNLINNVFAGAYSVVTGNMSRYDTSGAQIGQGGQYGSTGSGTYKYFGGQGGTTVPLAGSLLHATQGSSGANGSGGGTGGTSLANTFFAGGGGGSNTYSNTGYDGQGGGGGGGGGSSSASVAGAGGNGAANSGGGGGGGGRNTSTASAVGNGGNGGSGFVVIGYWG